MVPLTSSGFPSLSSRRTAPAAFAACGCVLYVVVRVVYHSFAFASPSFPRNSWAMPSRRTASPASSEAGYAFTKFSSPARQASCTFWSSAPVLAVLRAMPFSAARSRKAEYGASGLCGPSFEIWWFHAWNRLCAGLSAGPPSVAAARLSTSSRVQSACWSAGVFWMICSRMPARFP